MYLDALATAVPDRSFNQEICWQIAKDSAITERLRTSSMTILRKVLLSDNGIDQRHFAIQDVAHLFDLDADTLNRNFQKEAPALATSALRKALDRAALRPEDLDAVFICTCTGYLCPGITSYLSEQIGLKPDAHLVDLVGLGCGAAIPTLRTAAGFLAANPDARIACIAVEICSAAFYLDDNPGVLISACLFGDGAAATLWSGKDNPSKLKLSEFDTVLQPEHRDLLRFEMKEGKLRNRLARTVPERAAETVGTLYRRRPSGPVGRVVAHPGGRDVIDALGRILPRDDLAASASVLREHGNMSSPSVLFVLEQAMGDADPADDYWLVSFGAGFAAHACRLSRS